ncbi:MAG: ferrous iron transport protein B [Candidatus Bipolaricaulota bacterium]|nr:ferrous iron transport protein B [Candidatus Bipolaricaulota bacterium]
MIRIALVGQPNCGKSTIFNHLVGYKANTSNLPGTTVEYLKSTAMIGGRRAEIIDLPGTYSLTSLDLAEAETRNFLLTGEVDAVLNVIDASLLSRSLELTLQLLEMGIPLVVCLNMEDEARRKGIMIDEKALEQKLGVPVISTIAVHGVGVKEATTRAVKVAQEKSIVPSPTYSNDVERVIDHLTAAVKEVLTNRSGFSPRLVAIKLLEGDSYFTKRIASEGFTNHEETERLKKELTEIRGGSGEGVLSAERHNLAMKLFEEVAIVGKPTLGFRDRIDALLMHRVFGPLFFAAIMYTFFVLVFKVGALVEGPMMGLFDSSVDALAAVMNEQSLVFALLKGMIQGIGGAIGIVLPYLVPFLAGLAVLEDIGYLPRAGYLMDGLMHKIGLHGKSVIPFILGYGCSVPAVMATRILDSPRDRFITAMLSVMVPCVARTTIIFGLVGYFLGPTMAFLLYIINILVIAIAGKVMTKIFPRVTPGLILEIPSYKVPSVRVVVAKVWLRVREFIVLAFPLLIAGSLLLSLFEYIHWDYYLNLGFLPITWALGLPMSLGVTLIFGIFRKELSLIMLFQALGTTQVASVLSAGQMMTFTLFVIFYIPCVATIAVLARELRWRKTFLVLASTTGIALVVALIARGIAVIIG